MIVSYQPQNIIEFGHAFLDQDKKAIDISTLTDVKLCIQFSDGNETTVNGTYSPTAAKNLAIAQVASTTITNAKLSHKSDIISWQIVVTLNGVPLWSPPQELPMKKNLAG